MLLKEYMAEHGLSPAAMAEKIGEVTGEAVRLWASGRRMPQTDQVERIKAATEGSVSADDLHEACIIFKGAAQESHPTPLPASSEAVSS